MRKIGFMVFLMILLLPQVYSLGISPARDVIDFESGLTVSRSVKILNNEYKDMTVVVMVEGNLSEYVELGESNLHFNANESEKLVNYKVYLPQKMDKPGNHDIELLVMDVPSLKTSEYTTVMARTSVISQIRIKVPYPGLYAEAELDVRVLDDDVLITIPIHNLGSRDFKASARIKIIEGVRELDEIITDDIDFEAGSSGKITAHWSAPAIGAYTAVVEIDYGKKIRLEKEFYVGDKFIRIVDVKVGEFRLGDVARIDVIAQNGWNELIEDVYCDVFVRDKNGNTLAVLKTASEDIDALSKKVLTAYWDTKGVDAGVYDLFIKLNYAGKYSEESTEIDLGITARVVGVKPLLIKMNVAVIIIVIVVLIVGFFIYFRKKRDEVKEFENELEKDINNEENL